MKRPTLYDVAEQSGVSYQTVSRVVNGSPHVSSTTRQRVLDAIKELDYQPNKAARTLVTRRSFTLELIAYGVNYYGPAQMMISFERAAKKLGYKLMFSNIDDASLEAVQTVLDSLNGHLVDGFAIIAPTHRAVYDELTRACQGIPLIHIGTRIGSKIPSVVIDQHQGSRLAAQHLIDLGHRRIAEISGPLYWYDAIERHEGWLSALRESSLTPGPHIPGDWTAASGYRAAQQLLQRGAQFTGLVVGNDQMALGAIRALREHHLRIPEDVSIVGFDDIPEAAFFDPPLTTVRQDFDILGKQSVEYLIQMIQNPEMVLPQRVLYPNLVQRDSTRAHT